MKAIKIFLLCLMMVLNPILSHGVEKGKELAVIPKSKSTVVKSKELAVVDKPYTKYTIHEIHQPSRIAEAWKSIKAKLKDWNTIKYKKDEKESQPNKLLWDNAELIEKINQTRLRAKSILRDRAKGVVTGVELERRNKLEVAFKSHVEQIVTSYNELKESKALINQKETLQSLQKVEKAYRDSLFEFDKDGRVHEKISLGQKDRPKTYTELARKKVIKEAKGFAGQLGAFTAASLIMGRALTGDNPVSFEQSVQAATDPHGWASFYGFVLGHRAVSGAINRHILSPQSGFIAKNLSNFTGMAAGMLISSTLHELMVDSDRLTCNAWEDIEKGKKKAKLTNAEREVLQKNEFVKANGEESLKNSIEFSKIELSEDQIFNFKANQGKQACIDFHERWFTQDKWFGMTPDMISLIGSAAGSSLLNAGLQKMSVKVMNRAKARAMMAAISKNPILGSSAAGKVAKGILVIGNFVVFLGLEHMIAPYVHAWWGPTNFKKLGLSLTDEVKKNKAEQFSTGVRSYNKNQRQMKWLRNKAKDKTLYKYATDEYLQKCIDKVNKIFPHMSEEYRWNSGIMQGCMRRRYPEVMIQNNYAFTRGYNELKLKMVKEKQANWYTLLGNFSTSLNQSEVFYKGIRRALNSGVPIETIATPEYLNAIAGYQVPKEAYPQSKNGIQFKTFAEYLIYNMACGAGVNETPEREAAKSFYNSAEINFVRTKFGSSLQFIPPRIAKFDAHICRDHMNSMGYYRGRSAEVAKMNLEGGAEVGYVFNHKLSTGTATENDNGEKSFENSVYKNMAEYVLKNIENKAALAKEAENIEDYTWWTNTISPELEAVWVEYNDTFERLMRDELLPKVYSSTYKEDYDVTKLSTLKGVNRLSPFKSDIEKETIIGLNVQNIYNDYELIIDLIDLNEARDYSTLRHMDTILNTFLSEARYHRTKLDQWKNEGSIYEEIIKPGDDIETIQKNLLPLEIVQAERKALEQALERSKEQKLASILAPATYADIEDISQKECNLINDTEQLEAFSRDTANCEGVEAPDKCITFKDTPRYADLLIKCPIKKMYESEAAKFGPIFASLEVLEKKIIDHMLDVNTLTQKLGYKKVK